MPDSILSQCNGAPSLARWFYMQLLIILDVFLDTYYWEIRKAENKEVKQVTKKE